MMMFKNQRQTKISIISPMYNAENYIERFLSAIKQQTYQEFQWILVDDGSSDNTMQVVEGYIHRYSQTNITILRKNNGGVSSARNLGLKYVEGDYITFADSDDIPNDTWLEEIVDVISKESQIDLLILNAKKVKPDLSFIKEVYPSFVSDKRGKFNELAKNLLSMKINGYLFTFVFRSELWKEITFDSDINFLEDELAVFNVLINNPTKKYTYTDILSYLYVQNPNSFLHTMNHNKRLNSLVAVQKMSQLLEDKKVSQTYDKELNRRKASVYFSLAKLSINENLHSEFKEYLSKYRFYEKRAIKSKIMRQRIFDSMKLVVSYSNSEKLFKLLAMRNEKIWAKDSLKIDKEE